MHYQFLWRLRNPFRAAFRQIKDRAKRKGIDFALSFEDFAELAAQTGYVEGKGRSASSLSIDRENAGIGYVLTNIRVMTVAENSSKSNVDRKFVFVRGIRIPLQEINLDAYKEAEEERRKSFVTYFQTAAEIETEDIEDEELPSWLK